MKKLACVAGLALLATGAFAQGTINFVNGPSALVTTNDTQGNTGAALAGMSPRVVLFYSTAGVAPAVPSTANGFSFAGWTQTTPTTPDTVGVPLPGIFSGGTQTAATAAGGSAPWVIVAGWLGGHADFATAVAAGAYVGVTPVAWAQSTGNPGGAPPTSPVNLALGPAAFNGLELRPIPEPSSLALAGLGAAALLVFRRRK
jgi:hypothetical protein